MYPTKSDAGSSIQSRILLVMPESKLLQVTQPTHVGYPKCDVNPSESTIEYRSTNMFFIQLHGNNTTALSQTDRTMISYSSSEVPCDYCHCVTVTYILTTCCNFTGYIYYVHNANARIYQLMKWKLFTPTLWQKIWESEIHNLTDSKKKKWQSCKV